MNPLSIQLWTWFDIINIIGVSSMSLHVTYIELCIYIKHAHIIEDCTVGLRWSVFTDVDAYAPHTFTKHYIRFGYLLTINKSNNVREIMSREKYNRCIGIRGKERRWAGRRTYSSLQGDDCVRARMASSRDLFMFEARVGCLPCCQVLLVLTYFIK